MNQPAGTFESSSLLGRLYKREVGRLTTDFTTLAGAMRNPHRALLEWIPNLLGSVINRHSYGPMLSGRFAAHVPAQRLHDVLAIAVKTHSPDDAS